MSNLIRTTIWIEQDMWDALGRLAEHRTAAEERHVSKSELVRRGIARESEQARKGEEGFTYVKP